MCVVTEGSVQGSTGPRRDACAACVSGARGPWAGCRWLLAAASAAALAWATGLGFLAGRGKGNKYPWGTCLQAHDSTQVLLHCAGCIPRQQVAGCTTVSQGWPGTVAQRPATSHACATCTVCADYLLWFCMAVGARAPPVSHER